MATLYFPQVLADIITKATSMHQEDRIAHTANCTAIIDCNNILRMSSNPLELGNPESIFSSTKVAKVFSLHQDIILLTVEGHIMGLDGTIYFENTDIVDIVCILDVHHTTYCLQANGNVLSWDRETNELTPTKLQNIVRISARIEAVIFLRTDGKILDERMEIHISDENIIDVVMNNYFLVTLKVNGTLECHNTQIGMFREKTSQIVKDTLKSFTNIKSLLSSLHADLIFIRDDNKIVVMGSNSHCQLGLYKSYDGLPMIHSDVKDIITGTCSDNSTYLVTKQGELLYAGVLNKGIDKFTLIPNVTM